MLGQFSTELLTLYPGANILVAVKEDFKSQNRKKLFSRIATGNWDAVIVTHSGFERIPLARETQERFFEEQLHELEMIKHQHADSSNRRLVKEIERAKKRLEARLQALAAEHRKDNTLTFEELGVDRLFVDKAHYFKNLFYVTKMTRIAGLPQTSSGRAFDMYLKVRHVQSLNGTGGVVFATGTPIANSMAEMQAAAGEFARDYNRREDRKGAFWEGRYHATIVDSGEYLWECLKYVELNRVRCGVASHPREWEWSGYRELMGGRRRNRFLNVGA